jgi:hypothetical protein
LKQQRQHVLPLGQVPGLAAAGDLAQHLGVHLGQLAPEAAQSHDALRAEEPEHRSPAPVSRPGQELAQDASQTIQAVRLLDAEHRPHDHFEGHRLHVRQHGERLAHRPAGEVPSGDAGDDLCVGLHPVAVERRQHQLAPAQVLRPVEQEHVARA